MLLIRNQQVDALREASLQQASAHVARHLSSKYPAHSKALGDESAVQDFARRSIHRAASWGIESTESVSALLELLIQFGENFDHSPLRDWSLTILRHPVLAGDLKVDTVWTRHQKLTQGRTFLRL